MDTKNQGATFFGYRLAIFFLALTICAQSFVILQLTGYEFNFALSQNTKGVFPLDLDLSDLIPELRNQPASASLVPRPVSYFTEYSTEEILDGEFHQLPGASESRQVAKVSKTSKKKKRSPASVRAEKQSVPDQANASALSRESMMSALQQAAMDAAEENAREAQGRREVRRELSSREYAHTAGVIEED